MGWRDIFFGKDGIFTRSDIGWFVGIILLMLFGYAEFEKAVIHGGEISPWAYLSLAFCLFGPKIAIAILKTIYGRDEQV